MRKMLESIKEIKIKEYLKFIIYFASIFVLAVVIDQASKYTAVALLTGKGTVTIIPNFIDFVLVYNTGAAWGMGGDEIWSRIVLVSISWIVFFFIFGYVIYAMAKNKKFDPLFGVALALIHGGNFGNLIDRTFFFNRGVIDFISIQSWFPNFGIFNIADSCLVVGLILLIVYFVIDEFKEQKRQKLKNEEKIKNGESHDTINENKTDTTSEIVNNEKENGN